jgi:lysozyme
MRRLYRSAPALGLLLLASCEVEEPSDPPPGDGSEEIGVAEQAAEICFTDVVHGIDVSYYQGTIDWTQVATEYDFAIARINHGDFMDPQFDANWAGIKAVGMIRGAYQYFDPGGDPVEQANIVVDKLGMLDAGDLPPVIDVESTDGLGGAEIAARVGVWLDIVEAGTGKKPMIYTGKYFWQDNVGSSEFADYALWHAQYPNACQPPAAPPPACGCSNIADQWSEIAVWQYSSSGSVPGIAGNVDLNVWNGTYEELVAFASGGSYGATLASVEAPEVVLAGETFKVRVTYTNSGGQPWDASTLLGTTMPRDRASEFQSASWPSESRAAAVTGSVTPGQSYTFELDLNAPAQPGTYSESFGLVQEGVAWFADQGGPPDDAVTLELQVIVGNGEGGATGAGGAGSGGGEGGAEVDDDGSEAGCSCATTGRSSPSAPGSVVALAALALALGARRQRSQLARATSTP